MKLFYSGASPYVRKCMVVAHELGLAARIEHLPAAAHPVNRDPNIVRSIEAAVQREPLPYRGFENVFARKVTVPFCFPREICTQ